MYRGTPSCTQQLVPLAQGHTSPMEMMDGSPNARINPTYPAQLRGTASWRQDCWSQMGEVLVPEKAAGPMIAMTPTHPRFISIAMPDSPDGDSASD